MAVVGLVVVEKTKVEIAAARAMIVAKAAANAMVTAVGMAKAATMAVLRELALAMQHQQWWQQQRLPQ